MNSPLDPRGVRFSAALSATTLALALLLDRPLAVVLLTFQGLVFAIGTALGPGWQPYGWLFRTLIRPRLDAPSQLEDARPARFAQGVGLAFTLLALLGAWVNPVVFWFATGLALVATLLNAVFGFCLGCEMYLLGVRWFGVRSNKAQS